MSDPTVCAIVCEYDPFHNGHQYQLSRARELTGADYLVCIMSGCITQRGTFARYDRHLRTLSALRHGADLVLELPVRFSCASAPEFAGGAVSIARRIKCTHLSFGCEPELIPYLTRVSALLRREPDTFAAAQAMRKERGKDQLHEKRNPSAYSGMVWCGKCGSKAFMHSTAQGQFRYWTCDARRSKKSCDCKNWRDEELMAEMEQTLPADVPHIFISSITGLNIQKLKDLLWSELQKEVPVANETLVHRPKEITYLQQEMEEEGEDEDITPTTIFMDEEEEDWHDFYDEDEDIDN